MAQCKNDADKAFPCIPQKMRKSLINLAEWWMNLNAALEQAGIDDLETGIEMFEHDPEIPCAFTIEVDESIVRIEAITQFEKFRQRPSAYEIHTVGIDDRKTYFSSMSDFARILVIGLCRFVEKEHPEIGSSILDVDTVVGKLLERKTTAAPAPGK